MRKKLTELEQLLLFSMTQKERQTMVDSLRLSEEIDEMLVDFSPEGNSNTANSLKRIRIDIENIEKYMEEHNENY